MMSYTFYLSSLEYSLLKCITTIQIMFWDFSKFCLFTKGLNTNYNDEKSFHKFLFN